MNKNRPEECRGLAERNMWHRDGNASQSSSTTGEIGILHKHLRDIFKENGFSVFKLLCG